MTHNTDFDHWIDPGDTHRYAVIPILFAVNTLRAGKRRIRYGYALSARLHAHTLQIPAAGREAFFTLLCDNVLLLVPDVLAQFEDNMIAAYIGFQVTTADLPATPDNFPLDGIRIVYSFDERADGITVFLCCMAEDEYPIYIGERIATDNRRPPD